MTKYILALLLVSACEIPKQVETKTEPETKTETQIETKPEPVIQKVKITGVIMDTRLIEISENGVNTHEQIVLSDAQDIQDAINLASQSGIPTKNISKPDSIMCFIKSAGPYSCSNKTVFEFYSNADALAFLDFYVKNQE